MLCPDVGDPWTKAGQCRAMFDRTLTNVDPIQLGLGRNCGDRNQLHRQILAGPVPQRTSTT